jgi:TonB family protein
MYDDLARAQRPSRLEWLVVNMVIPSLLVTYALQWRFDGEPRVTPRSEHVLIVCHGLPISPPPLGADVLPVLVKMPAPYYANVMREADVEGRVILKALVDRRGRIRRSSIVVVRTTEVRFVASARDALKAALFRPARLQGWPIEAWVTVAFDFNANHGVTYARH